MKKFHFPLDPLLEQRRYIENECATTAASAQTELKNAETNLFVVLRSAQGARLEGRTSLTAGELQAMENLQLKITQTQTTITYLREVATAAEAELQAATRERKIVEHLRERRLKTHRETQIRAEQRDIEESNQCRPSGYTTFSPSSLSERY